MNIGKLAKQSIILFSFAGIFIALFPGKTTRVVLETITFTIIGTIFINNSAFLKQISVTNKKYFIYFFVYSIFIFIYGCFVANSYEQWRYLITAFLPLLLLPWFAIICSTTQGLAKFINVLLNLAIPLSFVFLLMGRLNNNEDLSYINYASFVYLLIFTIPYVSIKWKLIIIFISIFSLLLNLENRTNVLTIVISYLLLLSILIVKYTNNFVLIPVLKTIRICLFTIPLVLSVLGFNSTFDIFEFLEANETVNVNADQGNLTDSRTGIYQDAINSIHTPYELIFGNSPASIYETQLSDYYSTMGEYDKGRLGGSEAGILNFLQWGGLIYVVIVFCIFWYTSQIAIMKSNNTFVKLLGISIAFRWPFLFIEYPVATNFTWVSIFMTFGVCLSPKFREMTDSDIKKYFIQF